jgi:hypothetical protein
MFKDADAYKQRIRDHVRKHALVDFVLDEEEAEEAAAAGAADTTAAHTEEDDNLDDDAVDDKPMSDPDDDIMSDLDEMPQEEDGIEAQA